MGKFQLRNGAGKMDPYSGIQKKGLITPITKVGDKRPATDGGGRVQMGDKAHGLLERLAGKDKGGLQYHLLGHRAARHRRIAGELKQEGKETYTDKSEVQAHNRRAKHLEDKMAKVAARREGNRKLRGARNLALGFLPLALSAERKEVPSGMYTNLTIPKGMDPKDIPAYVNQISSSRVSMDNPEGVTGWINYNMDPNQSFNYDPNTGDLGFESNWKYRETGDYIYTKPDWTFSLNTARKRIKGAASFIRENLL